MVRRWSLGIVTAIMLATVGTSKAQTPFDIYKVGKYAEALARQRVLAAEIEKIEVVTRGKLGKQAADALTSLAYYALFARKFGDALSASERAHSLAPNVLLMEKNRAHSLLFMGRVDEARALYLAHKGEQTYQNYPTSFKMNEIWEDTIGTDSEAFRNAGLQRGAVPVIAAALGIDSSLEEYAVKRQADELYNARKYVEALPLAKEYVSLVRARLGEDGLQFARAIRSLGRVHQAQGRYAEAEPLFKRDLAISEEALGPDHFYVAVAIHDLANLYHVEGLKGGRGWACRTHRLHRPPFGLLD